MCLWWTSTEQLHRVTLFSKPFKCKCLYYNTGQLQVDTFSSYNHPILIYPMRFHSPVCGMTMGQWTSWTRSQANTGLGWRSDRYRVLYLRTLTLAALATELRFASARYGLPCDRPPGPVSGGLSPLLRIRAPLFHSNRKTHTRCLDSVLALSDLIGCLGFLMSKLAENVVIFS